MRSASLVCLSASLPYLESLPPAEILDNARKLEQFDRVAQRNFGFYSPPPGERFNLAMLTNWAAVQVISNLA